MSNAPIMPEKEDSLGLRTWGSSMGRMVSEQVLER